MKESRMLKRIRAEGELVSKRADIREVLDARFGAEAVAELSGAIDAMEELEHAGRVFRLAVRSSLDEVRAALAPTEQPAT